jgi:hypothetical protein
MAPVIQSESTAPRHVIVTVGRDGRATIHAVRTHVGRTIHRHSRQMSSRYSVPLWPTYSPQHPVPKDTQSMFFPYVRAQVSNLYKTAGKIIVSYIFIS